MSSSPFLVVVVINAPTFVLTNLLRYVGVCVGYDVAVGLRPRWHSVMWHHWHLQVVLLEGEVVVWAGLPGVAVRGDMARRGCEAVDFAIAEISGLGLGDDMAHRRGCGRW